MRFLHVLTVGFFLTLGVFTSVPISVMLAVLAPKTVEENDEEADKEVSKRLGEIPDPANETRRNTQISPSDAETQKEKLVQSKEIADPANGKKESAQTSPAEKPKVPSASPVNCAKIIEQQLSDFLERDLAKNIVALPLKPIATVAILNLPDGLKKAFFVGDKIYPGFSTLARLFISSSIGGSDCPGVDPTAPCYILLFPHPSEIISPLVCFKATPESLIVKNLRSEANKAGDWQLISPTTITEKAYNIWMAAPKSLFSKFKDFSTVTALFDSTKERVRNLLSVELDVESLSAFMPLPVLKLAYDTYIKKDFEKITYALSIDGEKLQFSYRYQFKPQMPWSVFCKALNGKKKTFHSLNFPSNAAIQRVLCWHPSASKNLLNALSTYAKEAEWKQEPIAWQVYRWGQVLYPLFETYLDFEKTASVGNGQIYNIKSGLFNGFGLEELKPSVTDRQLVDFLKLFTEKCTRQLASAQKEQLCGSNNLEGFTFQEEVAMFECCHIHKCAVKVRRMPSESPTEYAVFAGLYKGYLLYAGDLENMKRIVEQMKTEKAFSYDTRSGTIALSRVKLEEVLPLDPLEAAVEISRNTEVTPEVFLTTVSIPLSLLETVGSLIFGNTGSDKSEDGSDKSKDKSEDTKEIQKTNKSNVTNGSSNTLNPTRALEGVPNVSDLVISAQSTVVR